MLRRLFDGPQSEDQFESPELENEDAGGTRQDDTSCFGVLVRYVEGAKWDTYDRTRFDDLLDSAKLELQKRNYRQDEEQGFLAEEIRRFRRHFNQIPHVFSLVAVAAVLAIAFMGASAAPGPSVVEHLSATGAGALVVGIAAVVVAFVISAIVWHAQFRHRHNGMNRLLRIRQYNFYVLQQSLKQLQQVASERAQNEEPDKGASGLLQTYLTFICGYVLQKTIGRCFTRYRQYLDEIDISAVRDRSRRWLTAAAMSVLAAVVSAVAAGAPAFEGGGSALLERAAPLVGFVTLPTLAGMVVHEALVALMLRRGGRIDRRRGQLQDAYSNIPSDELLLAFGFQATDHDRFDFPSIYSWNDVKEYTEWFHNTLVRFGKHKDRVKD